MTLSLSQQMRVTRDRDGELFVSVSDLEDALRAAANAEDQASLSGVGPVAHALRLVSCQLRPAALASLGGRRTSVRFLFPEADRRLVHDVARRAAESDSFTGDRSALTRVEHLVDGCGAGAVRPMLTVEDFTDLENVVEWGCDSGLFVAESARLDELWRRLRHEHRDLAAAVRAATA